MLGPWKINEGFWVALVAYSIAALCLVAVVVVELRERRRTGRSFFDGNDGRGWFMLFAFLFIFSTGHISPTTLRLWPWCIIFPALNMAFLAGFGAVALRAFTYAFLETWHWRVGLWISFHLVMPAACVFNIYRNVVELHLPGWIWFLAGLVAAFLAPFFVRFAFVEMHGRGMAEPDTSPQPDFRLWRPGGRR